MAGYSRPPLRAGIFPKPRHLAARMGRWSATHRKLAIAGWLAFVLAAVALGSAVGTRELTDAESGTGESGRAEQMLAGAGFEADDRETVLVQSASSTARTPEFRSAVRDVKRRLGRIPGVTELESPYARGNGEQISGDRHSALIQFEYDGDEIQRTVDAVAAARQAHPAFYMGQIGETSAEKAIDDTIGEDFRRAEECIAAGIRVLSEFHAKMSKAGGSSPWSQFEPT